MIPFHNEHVQIMGKFGSIFFLNNAWNGIVMYFLFWVLGNVDFE